MTEAIGPGSMVVALTPGDGISQPLKGEVCIVLDVYQMPGQCNWGRKGWHICPDVAYSVMKYGEDECAGCYAPYHVPAEPVRICQEVKEPT